MEDSTTLIGKYAPDFEIPGVDDAVYHLARYLEEFQAIGVIFMCNHCPYVSMYLDRLKGIQSTFQHQGFTLVGINPNDAEQFPADSFENMKDFAATRSLNFPYLRDVTQDVARSFKAEKTPQAFLIDRQSIIRYSGAIDDNPENAAEVKSFYFQDAITQLLSNQPIAIPSSRAIGCSIKWR